MTWRRVALALVGLAVGSGAAFGALLLVGGEEHAAAVASSTTTTTPAPQAWWIADDEIPLGPTVMVLDRLTVEDGAAVLSYSLYDIHPVLPGWLPGDYDGPLAQEADVAPETWTLITADGEIPGTTSSPRAREARFPLAGDTLPEVLGIRLERYWMRIPYTYEVGLPTTTPAAIDADYWLAVTRLIEQTDSRVVQVTLTSPGGFAVSTDPGMLLLAPLGEGWVHSSGSPLSSGLLLEHDGTTLPDPIPFIARSAYWVPFDRPVEIDAGALPNG